MTSTAESRAVGLRVTVGERVMSGEARIPVVMNRAAGGAWGTGAARVTAAFRRVGVEVELNVVEPSRLAWAIEAAARRAPVVGVAGGDGSFSTAARVLSGGATALLPVPTGSLNHFARRLGIADAAASASAARNGDVVRATTGVIGRRTFLMSVSLGGYGRVLLRRGRFRPVMGKWPAACIGIGLEVVRPRHEDLLIEADGRRLRRRTPLVWIGLGRGSIPFSHEAAAAVAGRTFEVGVVRTSGRAALVRLMAELTVDRWRGRPPVAARGLELFHARRMTIGAARPSPGTIDGEPVRHAPPLVVRLRPGSLRLVTPRGQALAGGADGAD